MALMWTDREYLEREFQAIQADLAEIKADVKELRAAITDNRVELAKSGGLAMVLIALAEMVKYGAGKH